MEGMRKRERETQKKRWGRESESERRKEREKPRHLGDVKKFTRDLPRCFKRIFPDWQSESRPIGCDLLASAYVNFLCALKPFPCRH